MQSLWECESCRERCPARRPPSRGNALGEELQRWPEGQSSHDQAPQNGTHALDLHWLAVLRHLLCEGRVSDRRISGSSGPNRLPPGNTAIAYRSEEHTSELQSHLNLVC